ncbi:hypothetical protein PsAD37_00700 [Pseudovibrio sp. Ad37]|nr:hypothetical protein PsWM33_01036 [Pseudovibrio sp. WM33]KZL28908.1 hypothetical protein PsAD37_00700 [Pseudovibrio sp. Ad37]
MTATCFRQRDCCLAVTAYPQPHKTSRLLPDPDAVALSAIQVIEAMLRFTLTYLLQRTIRET